MMERAQMNSQLQTQSSQPQPGSQPKKTIATDIGAGPARPIHQLDRALAEFDGVQPAKRIVASVDDPEYVIGMLMKHALVLVEAREHRLAINLLRSLLMRSPEHPRALEQMGVCLREDGRYEEALKCFRALSKVSGAQEPRSAAQILIAETLYLSERDDVALATYREVLKRPVTDDQKLFDIYKNIGNIQVRAGDYDAAEEFYNKAFTINPNSDVLMVNYGTLEIQRESLDAAVQRFRRSVELNPENDKGWVGLALVHRTMGDHELAWANVQRAMDINGKNRTAIRLVIDWAVADHRFTEAIARLQGYLAFDGEDAEMSFTLAKIFTHVGRLAEARLEMERVLALDPAIEGAEAVKNALDREISRLQATVKA